MHIKMSPLYLFKSVSEQLSYLTIEQIIPTNNNMLDSKRNGHVSIFCELCSFPWITSIIFTLNEKDRLLLLLTPYYIKVQCRKSASWFWRTTEKLRLVVLSKQTFIAIYIIRIMIFGTPLIKVLAHTLTLLTYIL